MQVLIIDGEEDDGGEEELEDGDHAHLDMAEVSLNSVSGLTSPRTMKVLGKIGDKEVVVLVDSGATHNFVSSRLIDELALVVTGTRSVGVKLGNGVIARTFGCCKGFVLELPELRVIEDFLPF